jgi:AraC-like DNA-binding protein
MLTDAQTLQDYSHCIEDVMRYIREHISEPLDREMLAGVAGFSVPHFHRVFTARVGESAASYVRRLRLERAGRKLRMVQWTLQRSRWLPAMTPMPPLARRSNNTLVSVPVSFVNSVAVLPLKF